LLPLALDLSGRFEVWVPDLPGHGAALSDRARLPGLAEVRDRTASWLASLPGGPGVLGGHSLGAWVAREACRRGGARPDGLVLISPPAGGGRDTTAAGREARITSIRLGRPPTRNEEDEAVREEFATFVGREIAGEPSSLFSQAFSLSVLRSPRSYTRLQRDVRRARRKPTPTWEPNVPVLILCGDRDRTTPVANAREVAKKTPGSTLEVLDGAGHFPWADGSSTTAEAILAFLDPA
jgi:pimeloyl-ACP methyl ester carboxylesterase